MKNYKVPNSSSIWTNPSISLKNDEAGKPLIMGANVTDLTIDLQVRFEISNNEGRRVNHNWVCDKIKVNSFNYDPDGTMISFMTRLAYWECDEDGNYINR